MSVSRVLYTFCVSNIEHVWGGKKRKRMRFRRTLQIDLVSRRLELTPSYSIVSKFAAALVAIPASVLGGMTTFLFSSVAVSGIRIISTVPFTRRNRFILTASLSLGFGATLVPTWFSYVFTYTGGNHAKQGFFNAIILVMETGFAVTGFLAMFLNLVLTEEIEDEAQSITANEVDAADDRAEWDRIRRNKAAGSDSEKGEEKPDSVDIPDAKI